MSLAIVLHAYLWPAMPIPGLDLLGSNLLDHVIRHLFIHVVTTCRLTPFWHSLSGWVAAL